MAKPLILDDFGQPIDHFTQWDNNRNITIKGLGEFATAPEIHYWDLNTYRAIVVPTTVLPDGGGIKAPVPNILMTRDRDIVFSVYKRTEGNQGVNLCLLNIPVLHATQPEDYDWTENIDYINFTKLVEEALKLLDDLNFAKDQIIYISEEALAQAKKAAADAASAAASAEAARKAAEATAGRDNILVNSNFRFPVTLDKTIFPAGNDNFIPKWAKTKGTDAAIKAGGLQLSANGSIAQSIPTSTWGKLTYGNVVMECTYSEAAYSTTVKETVPFEPNSYISDKNIRFAISRDADLNYFASLTVYNPAIYIVDLKIIPVDLPAPKNPDLNKLESLGYVNGTADQYWGWDEAGFPKAKDLPKAADCFATCTAPAAPPSTTPVTWYVPKTMPRPSGNPGMLIDVFWQNGRASGLGYDVSLVWGSEGAPDNVTIVSASSTTDSLTGSHSIPTEGTVRYQLEESNGRKHWRYVSGPLLAPQFSSATAPDVADKAVPGMEISYLPGMEIYVQLDNGNTAETMKLVPDTGPTLPVYGNGTGAKTGEIPAGYILRLVNAGDHWQIVNSGGVSKEYVDGKIVTIEIEDRGGQNFWTNPVTTARDIIDMVNAGKEVRLSFYDTLTNTGDQIYPYENTRVGVPYFRRNVITADKVSRISWGVQYNGSIVASEIPYNPADDAGMVAKLTDYATTQELSDVAQSIPNVPSWAMQGTKPSYTASEVGALPVSTKIPTKTSDLTNDSGFTTIDDTQTNPDTTWSSQKISTELDTKTDLSLGLTATAPGDLIRVKSVDASGVPTAWERTSLEELEGKFELIESVTTTEEAAFSRALEPDGTPYNFFSVLVSAYIPSSVKSSQLVFRGSGLWMNYMSITEASNYITAISLKIKNARINYNRSSSSQYSQKGTISGQYDDFKITGNIQNIAFDNPIPSGSKIEIWAVRA